jgi:outer membrane protein assembly factor BamB
MLIVKRRAWLAVLSAITLAAALAQPGAAPNSQPNPYRTIENFFKMPDGRAWGSTSAVDLGGDGHIWVAERCGANSCADSPLAPVLEFDSRGKLLKSFGAGMLLFPHNLVVDGDGNIWVTDGRGHQIVKFNPDGKVLLTLGKKGVPGDGPDTFNQPSAVAIAPNGDIFVADGHGGNSNARVVKFSKDGTFLKTWGKKGAAPGEFDTPHCLAFDSTGRLFVGDRANNRIQIFDQDGKFLDQWAQFSRPSGLYIGKGDILYVSDSESRERDGYGHHPGWKRGIRVGSARTGVVAAFIPDTFADPEGAATSGSEGIAADSQGVIYGAEVGQKDLKKYVK